MSNRQRLDWYVPTAEWERFQSHVSSEIGDTDGLLAQEAENAMLEWIDRDDYSEAEELVDRLVEAAGRRPADLGVRKNKNSIEKGGDTTRVCIRVRPQVRDDFSSYVKQHCDDPVGTVLARALREYREGGRASRLTEKLDRVVDDAERVLEDVSEQSDEDSDGLGQRERNVVAISQRLPEQFRDDQLVEEIHDVAARGQRASDPTVETYRDLVTDHLGVEPHPNNESLWIPTETAVEILGDDVPDEIRKPVGHLDREDRVRRLQLELGRKAAELPSGKARMTVSTARNEVFDAEIAHQTAESLQREAAFDGGFETDETEENALRVDLETVADHDAELFETIIEYRDAESDDGLMTDPSETQLDDHSPDLSGAWSQMNAAEPAADGGRGDRREGERE